MEKLIFLFFILINFSTIYSEEIKSHDKKKLKSYINKMLTSYEWDATKHFNFSIANGKDKERTQNVIKFDFDTIIGNFGEPWEYGLGFGLGGTGFLSEEEKQQTIYFESAFGHYGPLLQKNVRARIGFNDKGELYTGFQINGGFIVYFINMGIDYFYKKEGKEDLVYIGIGLGM